jgi:drug/metabolite transporter (DMT)-like permease
MYASQLSRDASLTGTLVALCLPVAGAANWTINQYAQAHGKNIDLIPSVLVGAALSALLMLPLALPFQASAHDLSLLFGLGLGQLAIPCVLVVVCARVLKAPEVALLGLLEVIFGILLAWVGAGEVPGRDVLVGGSLVIGALLANELIGWRSRAVAA